MKKKIKYQKTYIKNLNIQKIFIKKNVKNIKKFKTEKIYLFEIKNY